MQNLRLLSSKLPRPKIWHACAGTVAFFTYGMLKNDEKYNIGPDSDKFNPDQNKDHHSYQYSHKIKKLRIHQGKSEFKGYFFPLQKV